MAQYLVLEQEAVLAVVEVGEAADNAVAVPVQNIVQVARILPDEFAPLVIPVVVGAVVIDEDVKVVVLSQSEPDGYLLYPETLCEPVDLCLELTGFVVRCHSGSPMSGSKAMSSG